MLQADHLVPLVSQRVHVRASHLPTCMHCSRKCAFSQSRVAGVGRVRVRDGHVHDFLSVLLEVCHTRHLPVTERLLYNVSYVYFRKRPRLLRGSRCRASLCDQQLDADQLLYASVLDLPCSEQVFGYRYCRGGESNYSVKRVQRNVTIHLYLISFVQAISAYPMSVDSSAFWEMMRSVNMDFMRANTHPMAATSSSYYLL